MIHYGDITKINGYDVPITDVIVGGSPCQNLSVAGKRTGLDGEESKLFMEQIRITKEMRKKDAQYTGRSNHLLRPRFFVWENVPGAFSSNKGQDFRTVLEEVAKIVQEDAVIPMPPKDKWTTSGCIMGDGWSIAWRILDAQFWGVPQRRRRIALVADFGGGCSQEVLFERQSLRGDYTESRTERKGSSEDAQGCIGIHDRDGEKCIALEPGAAQRLGGYVYEDVSGTLRANMGDNQMSVAYSINHQGGNVEQMVIEGVDFYNQTITGDKAKTLTNKATDSDHIPCVVMDRSAFNQGINAKYDIGIDENGIAFSHIAKGPGAVCCLETFHCIAQEDGTCFQGKARDYKDMHVICLQGNGIDRADTADRPAVVYQKPHYIVRRLTPLECERLQGYPDYWTDIGEYIDSKGKKKKTSDSARYKALGNSIALPPWKWILKRISAQYERDATLASLFDGIGGFPYLWEQINGKGSCLWASEIEDFPIAVTTTRIR